MPIFVPTHPLKKAPRPSEGTFLAAFQAGGKAILTAHELLAVAAPTFETNMLPLGAVVRAFTGRTCWLGE